MTRFTATLMAFVWLFQPPIANAAPTQAHFDFACSTLKLDCGSLLAPGVVAAHGLYLSTGRLGLFSKAWPQFLFIDPIVAELYGQLTYDAVVVHETVHYIDHNILGNQFESRETMCATEARAWHVENTYFIYKDWPTLADYTWQGRYGC